MSNDSVKKTVSVAFLLCVVCSVLVAGAAVLLRPLQEENKKLDVTKNLLLVTGLIKTMDTPKGQVKEAYKNVTAKVIDLSTGQLTDAVSAETFDAKKAAKDPKQNYNIDQSNDIARIKMRAQFATVYFVKDHDAVTQIVLPIYGKGLWSTLYGFLSLAPDTVTVNGLGFYDHGETPGLGGEVDNPAWKALWPGKKVLDPAKEFAPILTVIKGQVTESTPGAESKIDGLSGATITSRSVEKLVKYWLGSDGYGKFLAKFRTGEIHL